MEFLRVAAVVCLFLVGVSASELDKVRAEYKNFTAKDIAKGIAESLASAAPVRADSITTIVGAMSIDSSIMVTSVISRAGLSELIQADIANITKKERDKFTSDMIEEMRKTHLNALCTIPETKAALEKGVDFSYQYKWDDFTYFGKIDINNASCKNIKL